MHAYKLTQFDRVLVLDADALVLRNLDALFEASVQRGTSLMFTADDGMNNPGSAAPPVQGGFLLVAPSPATYRQLVETVRQGDFRPGSGWAGSRIGWCWGGRTIQGLLAYHYRRVAPPAASVQLDACRYNRMHAVQFNCSAVPLAETFTAHFTLCQKPWAPGCSRHTGLHPTCRAMHRAWWRVRAALECSRGLTPTRPCGHAAPYAPLVPRLLREGMWVAGGSVGARSFWSSRFWLPGSRGARGTGLHGAPAASGPPGCVDAARTE